MEVAKKGQKAEKKPTNAQLQRRIDTAIIHMERTKDTKEVFFDDRNISVVVNEEMALLSNGIYSTTFQRYFFGGESNQYACLSLLVDCAKRYEDKIITQDKKGNISRSFAMLIDAMEKNSDKDYAWILVLNWYIYTFEANIALAPREDFTNAVFYNLYEKFAHSAACIEQYMAEHKDGMTNKEYFRAIAEKLIAIADDMNEDKMFEPISDEEMTKKEIEALQKDADEKLMEEQANAEQQK